MPPQERRALGHDRDGAVALSEEILSLEHHEVGAAAGVIARALHDDPLTVRLFPDDRERERLAPLMFNAFIRYDQLFGRVDHLAAFAGAASWLPPGTTETAERLAEAGFDDLPDEVPVELLDAVFDSVSGAFGSYAAEPHWHLRLLGVDPGTQSKGLGTTLLRHGLRYADAEAQPVLLETFAERTLPFYARNGFEVVVDGVNPPSGIPFWGLRYTRSD